MRNKIALLGMKDINEFMGIISGVEGTIDLFNPKNGHRVSGRSMLGVLMAATEWGDDCWIDSEKDIYRLIERFCVENDSAVIHN